MFDTTNTAIRNGYVGKGWLNVTAEQAAPVFDLTPEDLVIKMFNPHMVEVENLFSSVLMIGWQLGLIEGAQDPERAHALLAKAGLFDAPTPDAEGEPDYVGMANLIKSTDTKAVGR